MINYESNDSLGQGGFQQCSVSMLTVIVERYGYKLVSVGGTKDALYVQEGAVGGFVKEVDVAEAYHAFTACCLAQSNPSMTQYIVTHPRPGFTMPADLIPPTKWYDAVDSRAQTLGSGGSQLTARLDRSMSYFMTEACKMRAQPWASKTGNHDVPDVCPFGFVLNHDPNAAATEFIAKVIASPKPVSSGPSTL
jgi:hypothetical protein